MYCDFTDQSQAHADVRQVTQATFFLGRVSFKTFDVIGSELCLSPIILLSGKCSACTHRGTPMSFITRQARCKDKPADVNCYSPNGLQEDSGTVE